MKSMLARQGIIAEGYSLVDNAPFANKLGFYGYVIFTYNLKNLDHNKKTRFIYALIGRRKERGILKQLNIIPYGKGVYEVPIENSLVFEEFLKKWDVNYNKKNILISQI